MDNFLGEIRIFAGNFPPHGWLFCDGQSLLIANFAALYSLLGTSYGGNGVTTFNLPNFQAAAPLGAGNGPTLTPRVPGQTGGAAAVTLNETQVMPHTHNVGCCAIQGSANAIQGGLWAVPGVTGQTAYASSAGPTPSQLSAQAIASSGLGGAHNNMPPFLAVTFIIAIVGQFPAHS